MDTNDKEFDDGGIRFISPTTDFGFKRLFGDARIMKGFLNALFSSKNLNLVIEDLEYIDKEELGADKKNRGVIYDLRCKLTTGEVIIVEIRHCFFVKCQFWFFRSLYPIFLH